MLKFRINAGRGLPVEQVAALASAVAELADGQGDVRQVLDLTRPERAGRTELPAQRTVLSPDHA